MADAIIQIEIVWSANYQPWLSTNYPWCTTGGEAEEITLSEQAPTIIEGDGETILAATENIVLAVLAPNITEGTGISVSVATEDVALSEQAPTIVEGLGIDVLVGTENFSLSPLQPTINLDYTIFPNVLSLVIGEIEPRKVGPLWELRTKPSSSWSERAGETTLWEERNQVLWSPLIFPWASGFFPWLVEDRREIPTYTIRIQPTTNYSKRVKPTTTWQR